MRFTFQSALVSSFLLASTSLATPLNFAALAPRGDGTLVGCYSSSDSFTNSTTYTYQSQGWCQDYCNGYDAGAFALTNGDGCSCGNELPPSSDKVDTSKCSTKCDGWPSAKCGGNGYYSIYTLKANVGTVSTTGSSSSSSSSNNSTATQTNSAGQTVSTNSGGSAVTVTSTSANEKAQQSASQEATKEHSDHNTAAIAAGVVVGVVGLAALAGAIFFFYRSRKQKAQGYRGRARGSVGPSMSDSRFDGQFMAQRRQSNGSIDDDHDFSRRILQVTNPDR